MAEEKKPYQILPPLDEEEFAALKTDIAARGVLVAIEVDEDGNVIDGHHRQRAWQQLTAAGTVLPAYPVVVRSGMSEPRETRGCPDSECDPAAAHQRSKT
jgi:ParB-like chromosome segregation protein Spo0J